MMTPEERAEEICNQFCNCVGIKHEPCCGWPKVDVIASAIRAAVADALREMDTVALRAGKKGTATDKQ